MKNSWFRYEYKGKEIDLPRFDTNLSIVKYLEKNKLPLSEAKNFKFITQMVGKELPTSLIEVDNYTNQE